MELLAMAGCCLLACCALLLNGPLPLLLMALHAASLPEFVRAAVLGQCLAIVAFSRKFARAPLHALARAHASLAKHSLRAMGVPPAGIITTARTPSCIAPPFHAPGVRNKLIVSAHFRPGQRVTWLHAPMPAPVITAPGSTRWAALGEWGACRQGAPVVVTVHVRSGKPAAVQPRQYRGQATEVVVSIKIHSHEAYQQRDAVYAALTHHLCSAPTTPPTLLATTLLPGCLQLFLSSFVFNHLAAAAPTTLPHPPTNTPPATDGTNAPSPSQPPATSLPLDTLIAGLHSALPSFCHEGAVSVQVGPRRAVFQTPPTLPQYQDLQLGASPPFPSPTSTPSHGPSAPTASTPSHDAPAAPAPAGMGGPPPGLLLPQLSSQLLLEPPCVPTGAAGPVAVAASLQGCDAMLEGEQEVEVAASWVQHGAVCTHKLRAALDASSNGFRLELPAGLDTGAVSLKVASLRPGFTGTLLAATTTMALPPPAAQELCDLAATSASACDRAGVRRLLLDMAVAWQLLDMEYDGPAGPTLLAGLLQYCSDAGLDACQALLDARCTAAGWLVVHAAPAAAGAGAAADQATVRDQGQAPAPAVAQAAAVHATAGGQASSACAAAAAAANGGAAAPHKAKAAAAAGSATGCSSLPGATSTCPPSCAAAGQPAKPTARHRQAVAASTAASTATSKLAGTAPAAAAGMTYSEWRQQLAHRMDRVAPTAYAAVWVTIALLVLVKAPYGAPQPRLVFLGLLLNWVVLCVPHVLLLSGGRPARLSRTEAMALQCAGRTLCLLGGCWLHWPQGFRVSTVSIAASFAVNSVFRPCFQLVSWRTQLLMQTIEMSCKALTLLTPVRAHGQQVLSPLPLRFVVRYCGATLLAALLTSILVEHWSRAVFARARGIRAGLAAAGATQPRACSSDGRGEGVPAKHQKRA